ncbi:hypothetical protein [Pseudolabrys sp.]|uniref:hypothetical protein n=1 Tax=Pseudolabrys sp. TaxID=1960880 RepID=UPI003D09F216
MSDTESSRGELDLSPGDIVEVGHNEWLLPGPAITCAHAHSGAPGVVLLFGRSKVLSGVNTCLWVGKDRVEEILIKQADAKTIKAFLLINFCWDVPGKFIEQILDSSTPVSKVHGFHDFHDF